MAERNYDRRSLPPDDDHVATPRSNDPLAELARLIGQTDPFGEAEREAAAKSAPRRSRLAPADSYDDDIADAPAVGGPPRWVQNQHEPEDLDEAPQRPHALQRLSPAVPHLHEAQDVYEQPYDAAYDDRTQDAYASDASHGYDDAPQAAGDAEAKRRKTMMLVAGVAALAVVGTGAALGVRSWIGTPKNSQAPVIRADNSPTKVVPAGNSDPNSKLIQDRMAGTGNEQIVSREEQPVDPRDPTKAGPRVVFPPLNANGAPPAAGNTASTKNPTAPVQALPGGDEPRRVRTFAVRGDQSDATAVPGGAKSTAKNAATTAPPSMPIPTGRSGASSTSPMSLSPQASNSAAPAASTASIGNGASGYVVQVSSQRSESDAQSSYRALQAKFPSVLASRPPVIKRADLGDKGTFYRAVVGPFSSPEEAAQLCGDLKTAGGQCVVQKN